MQNPKKSLGQNFLKSPAIAAEIVDAGEVSSEDVVLEVGPGKGVLTELLLQKAKKVIAVEKDKELVDFLREKFTEDVKKGHLELVCGDILKFNQADYNLQPNSYKLIANIPYYITSRFLRTFLESEAQPSLMVLMVQKEVAERIAGAKVEPKRNFSRFTLPRSAAGSDATQNFALARPSSRKESLLSISVKAYGRPEIIRTVSRGNFTPQPKVDSAVIRISGISKEFFKDTDEKKFFETVKNGFAHKRKLLLSNLGTKKENFIACGIAEKARAENLRLKDWKCLANIGFKEK